jgi:hypothetical protein
MDRSSSASIHCEELHKTFVYWQRKPLIREIYRDFYLRIRSFLFCDQHGCTVKLGTGFAVPFMCGTYVNLETLTEQDRSAEAQRTRSFERMLYRSLLISMNTRDLKIFSAPLRFKRRFFGKFSG